MNPFEKLTDEDFSKLLTSRWKDGSLKLESEFQDYIVRNMDGTWKAARKLVTKKPSSSLKTLGFPHATDI